MQLKPLIAIIGALTFLSLLPKRPTQDQAIPDWENPSVVSINKEPGHATLFPFESRELARHQIPLPGGGAMEPFGVSGLSEVRIETRTGRSQVAGDDLRVVFHEATGRILSYTYLGEELIRSGPWPSFWRAPTDKDYGGVGSDHP